MGFQGTGSLLLGIDELKCCLRCRLASLLQIVVSECIQRWSNRSLVVIVDSFFEEMFS